MEAVKLKPNGTVSSASSHKKRKSEQDSASKIEERMEGGIIVWRVEKKKVEKKKERKEVKE